MFLFSEYGGVIFMDRVVALVREGGRTKITLADNSSAESGFTPQALACRIGGHNAEKSPDGGRKGKH